MSDLPPFNASATCAKCAGTDVHTRYFPGDTFEYGCRERREHMHRACRRCGFEWIEDIARPAAPASRTEETRPQTPRDPTGESPPLETDPRARQCGKHGVLLYPGELCRACLASEPNGSAEGSR